MGKNVVHKRNKIFVYLMFACYLATVVFLVGLPNIGYVRVDLTINFILFLDMMTDFVTTVLNVLLFIPMGIFLPLCWDKYRKMKHTVMVCLGFTCLIEFLQLFTFRTTDINDIITNTLGGIIGYWIIKGLSDNFTRGVFDNRKSYEFLLITITVFFITLFALPIAQEIVEDNINAPYYNAKSLLLVECESGEDFQSKDKEKPCVPASLAKLFVIEYATTLVDLETMIAVTDESLALTPMESSIANISAKNYFAKNLYAAMLVPSGNDAAYALADYCGGLLEPQAEKGEERVNVFMEHLNLYMKEQGYNDTILYDPSGFDMDARTTTIDLYKVTTRLLEHQWFREIVSQNYYVADLPDGSTQLWENTNEFLNPSSTYYKRNVYGVKTGSLGNEYNLVVLYEQHGKEFLICSLGSESDLARYKDMEVILKVIDESDYLQR